MKSDPKPPLSPKEVLLSLHLQADHDDAVAATEEASDEEIEEELRKAGFDLDRIDGVAPVTEQPAKAKVRAVAKAPRDSSEGGGRVIPLRRPAILWLAAAGIAATLFAGTGVLAVAGVFDTPAPEPTMIPTPPVPPPPAPSPTELARVLRREAFEACGRGDWTICTEKLDAAGRLDPGGESDPRVLAAREQIVDIETDNAKRPPRSSPDGGQADH